MFSKITVTYKKNEKYRKGKKVSFKVFSIYKLLIVVNTGKWRQILASINDNQ